MEIKPKWNGWKEGVMKEDLVSFGGGYIHKKGNIVRYKKCRVYDRERITWNGEYEWEYLDQQNYNLIRCSRLLIE